MSISCLFHHTGLTLDNINEDLVEVGVFETVDFSKLANISDDLHDALLESLAKIVALAYQNEWFMILTRTNKFLRQKDMLMQVDASNFPCTVNGLTDEICNEHIKLKTETAGFGNDVVRTNGELIWCCLLNDFDWKL